jgi:hypothetical protein
VIVVHRLFSQNPVIRKFRLQPADDQLIRLAIGRGYFLELIEGVYLLLDQKRTVVVFKQDGPRQTREFRRQLDFTLII